MSLVGEKVVVTRLCFEGNTPNANDIRYVGKALNSLVTLVHEIHKDFYITDFFISEFLEEKNDYIHYGFLIVERYNVDRLR